MKVQFLTEDIDWLTYGGKWVSPRLNNGEFDYWLVIEFINMNKACGLDNEGQPKYIAEVSAVSPDVAGPEKLEQAIACCGFELADLVKVEALHAYGISALCDTFEGNNEHKVLRQAKLALDPIASMLGFFLDGPKNALGHSGWDCIKGDLSLATAMANREEWGDAPPPNMHVSM